MHRPDHSSHTAETAHHDDRVQFLVVGDESSLSEVEAELALLPLCARGRVFVEVEDAEHVSAIAAPIRMTVTWLTRATRSGRPGTGERCARGEAAARAVRAWATEMLCDGPGATQAIVTGGFSLVTEVRELLVGEVGMDRDAVVTPERPHRRAAV
ncbi:SIP domain-containing protein [Leifsonia sp. NPDC058194]|uniref:SIP domain-containing protein n=1 Tax=Leifsonia sp. NPDC058194 TaxID=3346374 RepID=UPI0036DC5AFB